MRKKVSKPLVGAKAKRMQARSALRKQQMGREGKSASDEPQHVQVLLIFLMSTAFAFLLTQTNTIDTLGLTITGNFNIDQYIVGPGVPVILADTNIDVIIVSFIRGLFIFAIAGMFPFIAKTYSKVTDNAKTNIFVLHWGTLVVIPFIIYVLSSFLVPLITELVDVLFL